MNCKPGDMAMVINASHSGSRPHIGKILVVIEPSQVYIGSWVTNPSLFNEKDGSYLHWQDIHLRPIRPSDEQDEMLRIVGLPNKEKEKA